MGRITYIIIGLGTGSVTMCERANKNWLLQHYFYKYSIRLALFCEIGFWWGSLGFEPDPKWRFLLQPTAFLLVPRV